LQFFSKRQNVRLPRNIGGESPSVDLANVDGLLGVITEERLATWHELKTVYTLEEALNLWEIIAVKRANEYLAAKHAERQRARQ
jgi:hypothetical protein